MPEIYYGYMIPHSLFWYIGAKMGYTEETHLYDTSLTVWGKTQRMGDILISIMVTCGLPGTSTRPAEVIVDKNTGDHWYMIAVAYGGRSKYSQDEDVLKRNPYRPTKEELMPLKMLLGLHPDAEPERRKALCP